jgi:RNA polymerase sigma-70 factor (ECF subfamily)
MQVARNRALDRLRAESVRERKLQQVADQLERSHSGENDSAAAELRLLLMCCHPALPSRSRVALALKTVGGFGVGEIARAFLMEPAAVAQVLVRAKRVLRAADAGLELPVEHAIEERLESARETVYLLFNEGYSATAGEHLVRADLCLAAIGFAELLVGNTATATPATQALMALLYFQGSRLRARTDAAGDLLLLGEQDRSVWDRGMIGAGLRALERSAAGGCETAWHLEAAIASCHAGATDLESTDWPALLDLYDRLVRLKDTPVVQLNRAVVLGRVRGPAAALAALDQVARHPAMARYALLYAARAEFLEATGDRDAANQELGRALELAGTAPERRLLEERRNRLTHG